MPFKTALTFTYDSGEFEKSMDMALKLADVAGFEQRRGGVAQARQAARHRPLQHHRARGRRRASRAPRSASTSPAPSRCSRAASPRARGTRPSTSRSCATASASTPTTCTTCRATPTRSSSAKAPAARARPPSADRPSTSPRNKITTKAKQIAAHLLEVDAADVNFADGVFSSPKTNRTLTIKEVAKEAIGPGASCPRAWTSA